MRPAINIPLARGQSIVAPPKRGQSPAVPRRRHTIALDGVANRVEQSCSRNGFRQTLTWNVAVLFRHHHATTMRARCIADAMAEPPENAEGWNPLLEGRSGHRASAHGKMPDELGLIATD
jgi:hypothetical protein